MRQFHILSKNFLKKSKNLVFLYFFSIFYSKTKKQEKTKTSSFIGILLRADLINENNNFNYINIEIIKKINLIINLQYKI